MERDRTIADLIENVSGRAKLARLLPLRGCLDEVAAIRPTNLQQGDLVESRHVARLTHTKLKKGDNVLLHRQNVTRALKDRSTIRNQAISITMQRFALPNNVHVTYKGSKNVGFSPRER